MKLLRDIFPERMGLGGNASSVMNYVASLERYIMQTMGKIDQDFTDRDCRTVVASISNFTKNIYSDLRSQGNNKIDSVQTFNYVIGIMEIVAEYCGMEIPEEYYWFGDDENQTEANKQENAKTKIDKKNKELHEKALERIASALESLESKFDVIIGILSKK